ncbi:hypothetical protein EFN05_09835, partial [Propionibacterium freudenreichii]|nr:hypothetical protein [Propionibacterium freudenreichii]
LAAVRARLGEHATSWAPPAVHRMLRHPSGFLQSPFADTAVAGESLITASRKLWHASPGSSGG